MAELSCFFMANIPLWASQVVLVVKAPPAKCKRCMRYGFDPWVGKIPWRRAWQPTLVFLPGESHGQRSQAGYSPWGHKELDTTEQVSTHITCQCSTVYITRIFFTHSSVDGHLRFFHVLAAVNSAAVNIGVHVSFLKMHLTLASYWTYHASCKCGELQFLFYLKNIYLFIRLCQVSIALFKIFSCSIWNLVPWPGIKHRPPALGARSLSL